MSGRYDRQERGRGRGQPGGGRAGQRGEGRGRGGERGEGRGRGGQRGDGRGRGGQGDGRGRGRGGQGYDGRGRGGQGGDGRGGGRGGRGLQPDQVLTRSNAQQYMMDKVDAVYRARPNDFLNQPYHDRVTPSGQALRPNQINQVSKIWKPVQIELNFFSVDCKVSLALQYDLQVNRQEHGQPLESREVYQQVFKLLQQEQNWPLGTVHDGRKTIWVPDSQGGLPTLVQHELRIDNGRRNVYVTFQFAKNIDMSQIKRRKLMNNIMDPGWQMPYEAIRPLDSALRQSALYNTENYALRGRQIFDLNQEGEQMKADPKYELLTGSRESVRVIKEGLAVNINTVYNMARNTAGSEDGSVLSFFENNGVRNLRLFIQNENLRQDLSSMLQGLKVLFKVSDQQGKDIYLRYTVKDIASQGADSYSFIQDDGLETTVQEYFWNKYGYKIKYPSLNLLECAKNKSGKTVMVPAELCRIVRGEFEKAKGRMQADLIKMAAKKPDKRKEDISVAVADVNQRLQESPANVWMTQLKSDWMKGTGFQMPTPVVEYKNDYVMPTKGSWQGWKQDQNDEGSMDFHEYLVPAKLDSYAVLSFARNQEECDKFCKDMVVFGNQHVMNGQIAAFDPNAVINCGNLNYLNTGKFIQYVNRAVVVANKVYRKDPQILFAIFPYESPQYDIVKAVLEGNNPDFENVIKLPSQVVTMSAFSKGDKNFALLKMLMLKVNEKLDGSNFRIAGGPFSLPIGPGILNKLKQEGLYDQYFPYMFMGADVTHPTGRIDEDSTSIAAVVGSMDGNLTRYAARIRAQKGKQESIDDMKNCTESLLEQFREKNGVLPKSIIMYRDGVSEGQFDQVLASEFPAIKDAISTFGEDYIPKITFVIVQKRHHTRPRPAEKQADDGKGNLMPGIVIGESGCHPFEFQFYLNSHATIQGTNRPALYTVLVDEIGFGAEQFQMLTYWITYTYQRCPRSVSIPPPAYYAHHACTRGRKLEGQNCEGSMVTPELEKKMYWI